ASRIARRRNSCCRCLGRFWRTARPSFRRPTSKTSNRSRCSFRSNRANEQRGPAMTRCERRPKTISPARANGPLRLCLGCIALGWSLSPAVAHADETALTIDAPLAPPAWALLQRELLRANARACEEYFGRYFDDRGYLECVERWGGDDGPDDAIENVNDWPILHALGAGDSILRLYKRAWEGHLRQYTAARTADVDFARDGMYYKEFPVK